MQLELSWRVQRANQSSVEGLRLEHITSLFITPFLNHWATTAYTTSYHWYHAVSQRSEFSWISLSQCFCGASVVNVLMKVRRLWAKISCVTWLSKTLNHLWLFNNLTPQQEEAICAMFRADNAIRLNEVQTAIISDVLRMSVSISTYWHWVQSRHQMSIKQLYFM